MQVEASYAHVLMACSSGYGIVGSGRGVWHGVLDDD